MSDEKAVKPKDVRVGLFSRIDFCGHGYREQLVKEEFRVTQEENTDFNILLAGLISGDDLKEQMKERYDAAREAAKEAAAKAKAKGHKASAAKVDRAALEAKIIDEIVDELAAQIPKQYRAGSKELVRLYIMTSPAYDGKYGHVIAEKLALKRSDIRYWAKSDEAFPLKPPPHKNFTQIACLVPTRRLMRSQYDSAPVDNVTRDYFNLANKSAADVVIVGCFGSSFYKPQGGESARPIISVPNSSRSEKNRASENQIGVTILKMTTSGDLYERQHNFNDLVVRERETINISDKFGNLEQRILEKFRERSWWTAGLLEPEMGISREQITKALNGIVKAKRLKPPLEYDKASDRYYIPRAWIQKNLSYSYPWPNASLAEERIIGFGCMHALCVHTVHEYMVRDVPKLILKHDVTTLVGSGDIIEGREHKLPEQGEVVGGADYTQQEKFAAWVVAEAMLRVFEVRFPKYRDDLGKKNLAAEDLRELVSKALLRFVYIPGNHDEWVTKMAFAPLAIFRYELVRCLQIGIERVIAAAGLPLTQFRDVIEGKINHTDKARLVSGICMRLTHLHMANAQTKTLRSQSILRVSDCSLDFHANFHTALSMRRYNPELGERVVSQLGTIKVRSGFEDRKGKRVDFGVGYVHLGIKNKRIVMSETAFFGGGSIEDFESFNNDTFLDEFAKKVGIRKF